MQPNPPLSNLQLELLKVFSHNVTDEDLKAIKTLLSNYFAQKAANLADEVWEEKELTEDTMDQWRQTHLRTKYKAQSKNGAHS